MDIDVFAPRELGTVLGVLRTALSPLLPLDATEQRFIATYAHIAGVEAPAADPPPIEPGEVWIADPHARKRLLQLAVMACLLHQPVRLESVSFVQALAKQLDCQDPAVNVLAALACGRHLLVRMLTMRRMFRVVLKEAHAMEGWRGVARFMAALVLRAPVNRDRLLGYKQLGLLPEGTFGREYWKHMTAQGFGFPGEPGGIPSSVVYHDLGHVLTGHSTRAEGEIQQGSFQGGNRREDGFVFVLFVLLHFHQGVTITPGGPAETGHFEPERVLWAIHRGAQCKIDITHQWDYWPLMPLSVEEVRQRFGLLPPWRTAGC